MNQIDTSVPSLYAMEKSDRTATVITGRTYNSGKYNTGNYGGITLSQSDEGPGPSVKIDINNPTVYGIKNL